jgi:hypothetical protein
MTRCRLTADQIDETLVEQFLDSHLPRCDCHATALRTHGDLRASLAHLLALLREQHVILELPGPSGPIAEELQRYNVHMRDARGIGVGTRGGRLAVVGRLLLCKFAGRAIAIGELQPEDVRGFIATELMRVNSKSHASALAAALRAYSRYRATCGDALHALLGVISSPVRWSLASLPRALTAEEVKRLLAYCTQAGPTPLRLLAMVHLALVAHASHSLRHTLACRLVNNGSFPRWPCLGQGAQHERPAVHALATAIRTGYRSSG